MKKIEARNIHKSFQELNVLQGIDLDVEEGEVIAVIGPSGSGKSTLMSILTGLYKPTEGCIMVGGEEVKFASPADAIASGIGTVSYTHLTLPTIA